MTKFQEEYSIAHQSFEDFILIIYVLIDDLYKKVAPNQVKYRRNIDKALLSDSEIITIALCGELVGVDSENVRTQSIQSHSPQSVASHKLDFHSSCKAVCG